jgi:predicted ArsR family transcriptional regulator
MSPDLKIIRYLSASRSTADALAQRLNTHEQAVIIILQRMSKDGLVEAVTDSIPGLTIWRLTLAGKSKIPTQKP